MTLEHIVDIYGSSIGKHLVSRRVEINKEGPFKGVKTYRIELWNADSHEIIDTVERTAHMTLETKGCILEALEAGLVRKMFEYGTKLNTK